MFEDEVLQQFLDNAVKTASRKEIQEKGILTTENAIPLLLYSQYNHILHLDKEITNIKNEIADIKLNMATKDDIRNMATKDDIRNTKNEIKFLKWLITCGFSFLAIMIVILNLFVR